MSLLTRNKGRSGTPAFAGVTGYLSALSVIPAALSVIPAQAGIPLPF
jgi:hypothetical protein